MRFLRSPARRLLPCGVLVLALARQGSAQACRSGPVSLELRASLQLPPNSGIAGVTTGRSDAVVLWSPSGEVFAVDRSRALTRWQLPDSIRPAGMAITPEGLRIFDFAAREFLRRDDGTLELVSTNRLAMAEQVDQALWRRGWVVGLRDLARRSFVVRAVDRGGSRELFRSATSDSVRTIQRYHLTESGRGLLLTRTMAPFTVLRLDPETRMVDTLEGVTRHAEFGVPRDSLSSWRALPAVSLDCTLLLTLSDLTADRRLLVRYGATDRVERVTELGAPLGLIGRVPGEDGVLAARRAGELELVWYDWHWVREPSSETP